MAHDFLSGSQLDNQNDAFLASLQSPQAAAPQPAMMAPPQPAMLAAPPNPAMMGYPGMMPPAAPPPRAPSYPPQAPPRPAPVWPPAGAAAVPQYQPAAPAHVANPYAPAPANPYASPYAPPAPAPAPPPAVPADPRLAAYAPPPSPLDTFAQPPAASPAAPSLGDALGAIDDGFLSAGGTPARRDSVMSTASDLTGADGDEGGETSLELNVGGGLEKYTVTFESEVKLGMLLERRTAAVPGAKAKKDAPEQTVVTMVIDGGAAAQRGVAVGSRLLVINGRDATALPYATCLDMVKSLPRPLRLVFEKSLAACDTAKGWILVRKSAGNLPPSKLSAWTRMYFVVGGAVAKRHVLQLYQTKAQYEDIVVRMFQGQPLTGFKYKAYALTGAFKCSAVQSKQYKGEHAPIKFFCLRNPYSRTKTMKFASENPSAVIALHNHVMRFATKG